MLQPVQLVYDGEGDIVLHAQIHRVLDSVELYLVRS